MEAELAAQEIETLRAEVERLTHLHELDHSLASQWEAKNVELEQALARWAAQLDAVEAERNQLRELVSYVIRNSKNDLHMDGSYTLRSDVLRKLQEAEGEW